MQRLGERVAIDRSPGSRPGAEQLLFGLRLPGLYLAHPRGDQYGIGAGLQCGAVLRQLAVALGDLPARGDELGVFHVHAPLGGGQGVERAIDVRRGEEAAEPAVQAWHDRVLTDVDVARVLDPVGQRVLLREPAPVARRVVDPVAMHSPATESAEEQGTELVWPGRAPLRLLRVAPATAVEDLLGLAEGLGGDDGRVDRVVGPDPVVLTVPAELRRVPLGDVLDVDEDFVLALAVPDLAAGVARVLEDRPYGALGPGDAGPVRVTGRVVRGRARDALAGEGLGDRVQAMADHEVGKDPRHDGRRLGVELQLVQPPAVGGLGRVRVRAGVAELVAVRRAAAQEAPFELRLGGHRGPYADLDAAPLPLAHAGEHRHDEVVRLVPGVDRPADLGNPERHLVVLEHGERQAVLIAVEGALWLADDDRVEPPIGVLQVGQERARARAPRPRDGAGTVDVEVLDDDLPAP